jgi:alpha-beta hydrolase superfamily lysophospholipase
MLQIHEYQGADGDPLRYGKIVEASGQVASSKALLFIPGLGGSVKGALEFLEKLSPDYNPIYGPDLRGFGLNLLEENPLTSAKIILEDLEAFYQQVIVPAQHTELVLCGLSLGGVLATLLACRYPERFSKLVLLAPAYRPHGKTFTLGYTIRNTLAFLIQGGKARTQLPYGLPEITSNAAVLNDPQYAELPPLVLSPGFLLGVRDLCNQAFSEIRRLQVPTLMVIPGQDIVCDPDAMRKAYARIPATTPKLCKEYPDFYHDVLFEAGHGDIAQALLGWPLPAARASCSASCSSI